MYPDKKKEGPPFGTAGLLKELRLLRRCAPRNDKGTTCYFPDGDNHLVFDDSFDQPGGCKVFLLFGTSNLANRRFPTWIVIPAAGVI